MATMRYLVVAMLAVVLFAAGYLAADLRTPDADAQGTWQYKAFNNDVANGLVPFLNGLPSDCAVDMESVPVPQPNGAVVFFVAYSCPD